MEKFPLRQACASEWRGHVVCQSVAKDFGTAPIVTGVSHIAKNEHYWSLLGTKKPSLFKAMRFSKPSERSERSYRHSLIVLYKRVRGTWRA